MNSHECSACGGRRKLNGTISRGTTRCACGHAFAKGERVLIYRERACSSHEAQHAGLYPRRVRCAKCACPVCLGSGRISDRVSREEVMADAETLREAFGGWAYDYHVGEFFSVERLTAHLWVTGTLGLGGYSPWQCAESARDAARAAFRAVPALRGDE